LRRIAHISDLHFGRHDPRAMEALIGDLAAASPDLVAISGDLTQRARRSEFAAARAFLDRLPAPAIAVPGNHDVPLYDLARRLVRPLHRFRRYISDEKLPFYADKELAVLGLNTARSLAIDSGRISHGQIAALQAIFADAAADSCRVLVTHHPLVPPPDAPDRRVVGRATHALAALAGSGVELLLTGHYHQAHSGPVEPYPLAGRPAILVSQAGTAISTRLRREVNSFNLLHIASDHIACEQRLWAGSGFVAGETRIYARRQVASRADG
jgi:3',5'-cyclic AMP phosphodiesterase CpdA